MFMEDKAKKVSLEMKPSTGKRADGESETVSYTHLTLPTNSLV